MNVSDQLSKVKLLDYYYQRRAESSIGIGDRFELTSAILALQASLRAILQGYMTLLISQQTLIYPTSLLRWPRRPKKVIGR